MDYTPDYTPVEWHDRTPVKRDDKYMVAGITGGKVRTCWGLMNNNGIGGGVVTAGARASPQISIVARLAQRLGLPCRCHTASGPYTPELTDAAAHGAAVVQHKPGYNSVIVSRATADARGRGWLEIPFGMECKAAIEATAAQVANLPWGEFKRIVIPVGSGMSAAGVLTGLRRYAPDKHRRLPMLGVQVGAAPFDRLGRWTEGYWSGQLTITPSPYPYHHALRRNLGGLALDPIYEAKCREWLRAGDLLWVVGRRVNLGGTAER